MPLTSTWPTGHECGPAGASTRPGYSPRSWTSRRSGSAPTSRCCGSAGAGRGPRRPPGRAQPAQPGVLVGQLPAPRRATAAPRDRPLARPVRHGLPGRRARRHRGGRPGGGGGRPRGLRREGVTVEASTVMTATAVHPPPRPNTGGDVPAPALRRRLGPERRAGDGLQRRRPRAGEPPPVRGRPGEDEPGADRGRPRRLVRGVPRRPARQPDGSARGEPRARALPVGRDQSRRAGPRAGRAPWCSTSAATASASWAPGRW